MSRLQRKLMMLSGILSLGACATPALDPSADVPARLAEPSSTTREEVQKVVEKALGVPVMLADDVFARSSRLAIERQQHRHLEQGVVMGNDPSGPGEQFILMRNGDACVLVRSADQSRWPVKVACVAE